MSSPRAYGGGFGLPSFSDTPIYDRLVAERGTPQIGPINVQLPGYQTGGIPALPAPAPQAPPPAYGQPRPGYQQPRPAQAALPAAPPRANTPAPGYYQPAPQPVVPQLPRPQAPYHPGNGFGY